MVFFESVPITGGGFGPCFTWPAEAICEIPIEAAPITGYALEMATQLLWGLTGMRFSGLCEVTLRPCRRECFEPWPDDWRLWPGGATFPQPALIGGQWFNLVCGGCPGTCSCSSVSEFVLPSPIYRIIEIEIDGTPLVTGWRVDNNRLVVREDGGEWPTCNDLSAPDGAEGTWTVTALYGEPVPASVALPMGELFCEIVRGGLGGDCRLPPGVTQLVRQGITIQYPDVGELFRQGRTGLYLVDMFVNTWNPYGLRQRSRVYSVDRPTVRRTNT